MALCRSSLIHSHRCLIFPCSDCEQSQSRRHDSRAEVEILITQSSYNRPKTHSRRTSTLLSIMLSTSIGQSFATRTVLRLSLSLKISGDISLSVPGRTTSSTPVSRRNLFHTFALLLSIPNIVLPYMNETFFRSAQSSNALPSIIFMVGGNAMLFSALS